MKNKFAGKGTAIAVLVIIAVLSMTVLAGFASSPETYADTIASLDKKKITVMELTAATLAASTALSAVPGDATNPAANQIANLSNYLMIVVCAIFLEKFLLTVIGHVAFTYILPIAVVLLGLWVVKLMFGINVDAPVKKLMPGTYLKKKEALRPADSEQEILS